jgi:hypothetical protein
MGAVRGGWRGCRAVSVRGNRLTRLNVRFGQGAPRVRSIANTRLLERRGTPPLSANSGSQLWLFDPPRRRGPQQGDWEGNAERLYGLEVDLLISAVLRGKLPSLAMSDGHDQSATLTI